MVESIPTITTFWKGERQWQQKKLTKLWLVKKKKKKKLLRLWFGIVLYVCILAVLFQTKVKLWSEPENHNEPRVHCGWP